MRKSGLLALSAATALMIAGPAAVAQAACPAGVTDPTYCTPSAPTAVTAPATALANTSATLNGAIVPNGLVTGYAFQFGTTTALGQATPGQGLPADYTARNVSFPVTGLTPGTNYFFRIVAFNSSGATTGATLTFTTSGTAPVVTPPTGTPARRRGKLSARVTPRADVRAPFRFTTRGKLTLPSGLAKSIGCKGRVSVQVKQRAVTLSTRRATLRKDCTYSVRVTFKNARRFRGVRSLKFTARFLGNPQVFRATAPSRFARVRR